MSCMPVDAKLQTILDAAKALGGLPIEQQTVEQARADKTAMMKRFVPMPEYAGVRVEERRIPAVGREIAVRIYRPAAGDGPLPVVVFFHGGGWVVCTLETHDPYCRALATEAGAVVVSVDYRLAPEHKFPAGVQDCAVVTEWVLEHAAKLEQNARQQNTKVIHLVQDDGKKQTEEMTTEGGDRSRVFVAGDSAGGTMAAVVALLLRDKGETGLAGQILIYPVTGYYDPPTGSYLENAEGYGLTRKGMMWFWDHYLNDKSEALDFRAVPLRAASLRGLARAFVVTADFDVLRDEAQAYAKRLEEAGVDVTHVFVEGMNHGFACSANEFPFLWQAKDVLRKLAEWMAE
jgi:acetyl esterase